MVLRIFAQRLGSLEEETAAIGVCDAGGENGVDPPLGGVEATICKTVEDLSTDFVVSCDC